MKKRKCDICSRIASKTVYSYKNDHYRVLCEKHASEVVGNMIANGWSNAKSEELNEKR